MANDLRFVVDDVAIVVEGTCSERHRQGTLGPLMRLASPHADT